MVYSTPASCNFVPVPFPPQHPLIGQHIYSLLRCPICFNNPRIEPVAMIWHPDAIVIGQLQCILAQAYVVLPSTNGGNRH